MPLDRRELLTAGAGGGLALLLGRAPAWARAGSPVADRCILLWLNGGPSHLDTFDPKPGARTSGGAKAIDTTVRGLQLAEHFPLLAARAKRLAVVRSLSSKEGDHARAGYLLHTGYAPSGTVRHPTWGSVVSGELPSAPALPAFVSLGDARPGLVGAGYLGAKHAPFVVGSGRSALTAAPGLTPKRRATRRALLRVFERPFTKATGLDDGRSQAYARAQGLLQGPLRGALDLSQETRGARDRYGRNPTGDAILNARRLVTAGVRCVEVVVDGWDDHQDLATRLPTRARRLDAAFAALLDDLAGAKLLRKTLIVCMGEFGRTPDVNPRNGRDHYPRAFSAVLAGGGLKTGRVVGATDPEGRSVAQRPVSVSDLYATIATRMGIDPKARRYAGERPLTIVDGGKPIAELM